MKQIVKVKFLNSDGEPRGREYSYYTNIPLALGDKVKVPVTPQNDEDEATRTAVVSQLNVPELEIADFKDRMKTITETAE